MASSWKKIVDKINEISPEGPFASDWEAMNKKIEAHPTLNTFKKRGGMWLRAGLGIVLLVLIALGAFTFWPQKMVHSGEDTSTEIHNPQPQPAIVTPDVSEDQTTTLKNEVQITNNAVAGGRNEEKPLPEAKEDIVFTTPAHINSEELRNSSSLDITETSNNIDKEEITDHPDKAENDLQKKELETAVNVPGNINLSEDEAIVAADEFAEADVPAKNTEAEEDNYPLSNTAPVQSDARQKELLAESFDMNKVSLVSRDLSRAIEELSIVNDEKGGKAVKNLPLKPITPAKAIDLTGTGFRITGLNVGAQYLTNFSSGTYGAGAGLDIDIQRKGLLLNTGLHYYQWNSTATVEQWANNVAFDTTYSERIETTVKTVMDSTWVIFGPGTGGYVPVIYYDIVNDTIIERTVDSTNITTKILEEQKIRLSYAELPILVGHRFRFNRFAIDVMGGMALNQLTQSNTKEAGVENTFGMDAILQPALRYYFLPEWSVFGRAGLRYTIIANEHRPEKFYSGFQLGLTYHW